MYVLIVTLLLSELRVTEAVSAYSPTRPLCSGHMGPGSLSNDNTGHCTGHWAGMQEGGRQTKTINRRKINFFYLQTFILDILFFIDNLFSRFA